MESKPINHEDKSHQTRRQIPSNMKTNLFFSIYNETINCMENKWSSCLMGFDSIYNLWFQKMEKMENKWSSCLMGFDSIFFKRWKRWKINGLHV